jgi:predicted O-methyltransferase YrrM
MTFRDYFAERANILAQIADESVEPFYNQYRHHLCELDNIVRSSGEEMEGSVFYNNKTKDLNAVLNPDYSKKRRTLALLANAYSEILEIGFNAGHSALLLLSANPSLRLTSIDIGCHSYTVPCYEYLQSVFPDRINLVIGNSLTALPRASCYLQLCQLVIIDGGHGLETAEADLANVISHTRKGTKILFDDSDWRPPLPPLRAMISIYIAQGLIIPLSDPQGYLHNTNQMLFLNNK